MTTSERIADGERTSDWIATYTGGKFWPLEPRADEVKPADIWMGLACRARFSGQCGFFSVAQHSILVANILPPALCQWALCHDAAEAFLPDISRPIKGNLFVSRPGVEGSIMEPFYETEERVLLAIAERFELIWPMPPAVKIADGLALLAEAKKLNSMWEPGTWNVPGAYVMQDVMNRLEEAWDPDRAYSEFKDRWQAAGLDME